MSLTVMVVTLAVSSIDHIVWEVTGVAHTVPTDAVSQSGAHCGAVVLPAASFQFLAALAVCLALTAFPGVVGVAPADATLHGTPASAESVLLTLVLALALTLGKDSHGHCVRETQGLDNKGLLPDAL